jgi:hypothetical protein
MAVLDGLLEDYRSVIAARRAKAHPSLASRRLADGL